MNDGGDRESHRTTSWPCVKRSIGATLWPINHSWDLSCLCGEAVIGWEKSVFPWHYVEPGMTSALERFADSASRLYRRQRTGRYADDPVSAATLTSAP